MHANITYLIFIQLKFISKVLNQELKNPQQLKNNIQRRRCL